MHPRISVIIPCYNGEKYLSETLDCILRQKLEDWECVIVNDGSSDGSLDIIKEYSEKDNRFRFLDKENEGPSTARNSGVRVSNGKFLLFLDSDDQIADDYLCRGVEYLDVHPECALYYSKTRYFGARNDIMDSFYSGYKDLLAKNSIVCASIIRRCDFDRVGGFDEKMKGYEDWEFYIRLLYHNEIVFQDTDVLFFYRMHDNPVGVNTIAYQRDEELRSYFFKKHYDIYREYFGYPQWIYGEYNRLEHELENLFNSRTYKIGHYVMKPLLWLKGILKK